jgi:glycosyltransferase involved in cell wall biosynthesis
MRKKSMKKITVIIPCHNEERGLGKVLRGIPHEFMRKLGYVVEVIVVDNNSTDNTRAIASQTDVRIIHEQVKGKGNAIKTGFRSISPDTDYVVMLDGDNTYKPKEMFRLLEPLINNFCDVTIGSRLGGKMKKNSFKLKNRIANWGYTFLVRLAYRANTTDVLSGYFAWKKEVIDTLLPFLESGGFSIEMEMVTKMGKMGYEIYSVPITYDMREGDSKIVSVPDGLRILRMYVKNMFWTPEKQKQKKTDINLAPSSNL